MRAFFVSLHSEFYKSRKTLAFWASILLPVVICVLMSYGFISRAPKISNDPSLVLWLRYIGAILGVMGILLLPILVIYNTYAITNLEYKGDTWKTLFSLPLPKFSIYASKFIYIVFLTFLTLFLFVFLIYGSGMLISYIKPELKFAEYNALPFITIVFARLFFSTLGIIAIQFLMNLIWTDFLKPFGLGFIALIMALITVSLNWEYTDFIPYAYPNIGVREITKIHPDKISEVVLFDKYSLYSSLFALVIFIIGYFIVSKKAIK
ncbi:MAG: ABC transporter permease [Pedobacter sp.]|nr:MAG: ABC transporter permease [Pedobacter sp.]